MRKLLSILYLIIFFTTYCNASGLGGFYAGPTLGYSSGPIYFRSSSPPGSNSVISRDYNVKGFLGGLDVGYGKQFQQYYIGPELQFLGSSNKSHEKFSSSGGHQSLDITQSYLIGTGLRFGYLTSCCILPYFYAGYAFSQFKVKESNAITSSHFSSTDSIKKNIGGPEFGLGIMLPLRHHLFFNTAIYHVKYNESIKHIVNLSTTSQKDASYSPSQNRLMVSIIYLLDKF